MLLINFPKFSFKFFSLKTNLGNCSNIILILKFLFTACYSCRAFFRRGVGASDQYQCTYGQKCKITLKSRKQCQYCRFHKCLEIGMKPTWVMTDEEKKEKREKTIKRKQLPPALPKIKIQVHIKAFNMITKVHSFFKKCLHFMKTRSLSPNLSKLAPADIS